MLYINLTVGGNCNCTIMLYVVKWCSQLYGYVNCVFIFLWWHRHSEYRSIHSVPCVHDFLWTNGWQNSAHILQLLPRHLREVANLMCFTYDYEWGISQLLHTGIYVNLYEWQLPSVLKTYLHHLEWCKNTVAMNVLITSWDVMTVGWKDPWLYDVEMWGNLTVLACWESSWNRDKLLTCSQIVT